MICLDHWTSHVCAKLCNLFVWLYRECQADLCKDVKMFILQTYANEEKRSQDMYWKWITRYLGTGHCL